MKIFVLITVLLMVSCNAQKDMIDTTKNLHDIWALKALNGKEVDLEDLNNRNQRPILEIFVAERRIGGNDGCNSIFGSITELKANTIRFGTLGGTKMACPDMKLPSNYTMALQEVDSFSIEKLHLYFYNKEGIEVLKFIKID